MYSITFDATPKDENLHHYTAKKILKRLQRENSSQN
jgi:hypothetical protein